MSWNHSGNRNLKIFFIMNNQLGLWVEKFMYGLIDIQGLGGGGDF